MVLFPLDTRHLTLDTCDMKGFVQVYTGNGKGKNTAALGLIVRASGAGLRVYIGQFIKSSDYSEIKTMSDRFPEVTVEQYGRVGFIKGKPTPEDIESARQGLEKLRSTMLSGHYDVIIADEFNVAVSVGLFDVQTALLFIDEKPEAVELVLTGRNAHESVIEKADLVTEMKDVKHYYNEGIQARKGIES